MRITSWARRKTLRHAGWILAAEVCLLLWFAAVTVAGGAQSKGHRPGGASGPDHNKSGTYQTVEIPTGGTLRYSTWDSQTLVEIRFQGKGATPRRITLERDSSVKANSFIDEFRIVGTVGKNVLIVTDTYDSRKGGLSFCQAGQEQFLRVLNVEAQPKQTFQLKLQSCTSSVQLQSEGILWNPSSSTLKLNWLAGPDSNGHEESRTYRIDQNGRVELLTDKGAQ